MSSPDNSPTDASDTDPTAPAGPSLARMLETWQAWNRRETFARAEQRARAAGDHERADRLRDLLARDREVAALDALRSQHEMSSLLAGWEWHTVRAAREQGATWADIARATGTDPEQARTAYVEQVGRQEQAVERGWLPFDDADEYRAAAGEWVAELHDATPDHVVEQIEAAIIRDDVDELAALRSAWWNPAHVTPLTASEVSEAATANAQDDGETNPWAAMTGADQVPHTHTAAANRGHEDPASVAVPEHPDDIWGPVRPGLADMSDEIDQDLDANDGYTDYTVAEAVERLTPVLGAEAVGDQVRGYRTERHGPPEPYGGGILDPDDLYDTVARAPRGDDPPATQPADGDSANQHDPGWWAQARSTDPDIPPVTFDASGFYSDAEIAAIGDALAAGDTARAEVLQDRPWLAQGFTVDTAQHHVTNDSPAADTAIELRDRAVGRPPMPEWMREQARRTEAEIAAGTYVPGPVDDPARFAARLAELREHATARDPGPSSLRECNRPARAVPACLADTDDEQDARREQLARWHTDDTSPDTDTDGDSAGDQDSDEAVVGPGTHCILVTGDEQR